MAAAAKVCLWATMLGQCLAGCCRLVGGTSLMVPCAIFDWLNLRMTAARRCPFASKFRLLLNSVFFRRRQHTTFPQGLPVRQTNELMKWQGQKN